MAHLSGIIQVSKVKVGDTFSQNANSVAITLHCEISEVRITKTGRIRVFANKKIHWLTSNEIQDQVNVPLTNGAIVPEGNLIFD